jgi:hypothetical protein
MCAGGTGSCGLDCRPKQTGGAELGRQLTSGVANPPLTPGAENRELGLRGSDSHVTPVGLHPKLPCGEGRSSGYATFNVLAPRPVPQKEVRSRLMLDATHTGDPQSLWR